MNIQSLAVSQIQARELWRKYQAHRAYQQPHDEEIAAIYKRIAQGRTIIRAFDAIRNAGVDDLGYPKLAIARADMAECHFHGFRGEVVFTPSRNYWTRSNASRSKNIRIDWPDYQQYKQAVSPVPLIPVHLRPKRGLQNYHVLFEAEWKGYPVDPYLLRRLGDSDFWLLVAAWELTSVERAVMVSRHTGGRGYD